MASAVPLSMLEPLRTRPLKGQALLVVAATVWLAGALYCSGYEKLSSGIDNWPGSLLWSAAAVLPWLALFEWSKAPGGRQIMASERSIGLALAAVAIGSLAIEYVIDAATGSRMAPLGLSLLRRLPAAVACLVLILWSRTRARTVDPEREASLSSLAASIDWIEAADNYVEIHIGGRTTTRRLTMREAEQALARDGFVRIHRRYLVNRRRIEAVQGSGGSRVVRLSCGALLPIGGAFAPNLPRAA